MCHAQGYARIGAESLDLKAKTKGDSKEGMYYGAEYPEGTPGADQPLMGNNQWPDEVPFPCCQKLYYDFYTPSKLYSFALTSKQPRTRV